MTREEAIDLVRQYQALCRAVGVKDPTLRDIADRWPSDGSERKAMRWLGFMQGALYATRLLSLGEIKVHSKDRHVPMPSDHVQTTDCGSVAPSMGRVVGGFRAGATSEGSFVPPKGHYNLVVQVANGSEPCPLYWTDVEIRPKKTDCGSVEGGE